MPQEDTLCFFSHKSILLNQINKIGIQRRQNDPDIITAMSF